MLVKKYRSEVISVSKPFKGIISLEFKSLEGRYKYHPGQFLHLALDSDYDGSGQWPDSRCFSMQSNPDESTIKITYSVKGRFTKKMEAELKVGSEVWLKLPYGDLFSQVHNKENSVFIAGGTGITPFLSLFTHTAFREYTNPVIYAGFRTKDINIYKEQLEEIRQKNEGLKIHSVYEDEEGILDILKIYTENNKDTSFFISGPPQMIKNFKLFLISQGLKADQVKTDDWE
jgi:ferredoxin-NADP reductase